MNRLTSIFCLIAVFLCNTCTTIRGHTYAEKRQATLTMKNEVLSDLYRLKPDVKVQIASAPGYAVFSNEHINLFLASFGGSYGVVKNNNTGKYTYIKMGEAGVDGEAIIENVTLYQLTKAGLAR